MNYQEKLDSVLNNLPDRVVSIKADELFVKLNDVFPNAQEYESILKELDKEGVIKYNEWNYRVSITHKGIDFRSKGGFTEKKAKDDVITNKDDRIREYRYIKSNAALIGLGITAIVIILYFFGLVPKPILEAVTKIFTGK